MANLSPIPSKRTEMAQRSPYMDLREQIDRLFEGFFAGWPATFGRSAFDLAAPALSGGAQAPSVDVKELPDRYEIAAEMPGIDAKEVELSLKDGVLTLKGEKKSERKEEKENLFLSERSYGTFMRSFQLPDNVDADRVAAQFENGVLKVQLPKAPEKASAAKKIQIQAK